MRDGGDVKRVNPCGENQRVWPVVIGWKHVGGTRRLDRRRLRNDGHRDTARGIRRGDATLAWRRRSLRTAVPNRRRERSTREHRRSEGEEAHRKQEPCGETLEHELKRIGQDRHATVAVAGGSANHVGEVNQKMFVVMETRGRSRSYLHRPALTRFLFAHPEPVCRTAIPGTSPAAAALRPSIRRTGSVRPPRAASTSCLSSLRR